MLESCRLRKDHVVGSNNSMFEEMFEPDFTAYVEIRQQKFDLFTVGISFEHNIFSLGHNI